MAGLRNSVCAVVRGCVALAAFFLANSAWAQTATFNIPAGDATAAIALYTAQSGIKIDVPAAALSGVQTKAVTGQMDVRSALIALIAGTRLDIIRDDGDSVAISSVGSITALLAPRPAADCLDDRGEDRCQAESRAKVLALMSAPSAEAEAAAGVEGYRVLQVDGYGGDLPVIAFERRPGASPRVALYGRDGRMMTASVPVSVWVKVRQAARLADRELVPPPAREGFINICMHSWVFTFEAADPPDPYARTPGPGAVRRRTEGACGGGLTAQFANLLSEEAIRLLPECDALDPDQHRNDASRLSTCLHFRGDCMAAAELMNQTGRQAVPDNAETEVAWSRLFGPNAKVRLDWAGQVFQGGGFPDAAATFLARVKTENDGLGGSLTDFDAVSSTRVNVAGQMYRWGTEGRTSWAPFRQVWVWDHPGQQWKLQSWTVEPFGPAR